MRTYLYKMVSDRGGAPCASEPLPEERPLLSLALCKPAIRRTAQEGDRLLAVTSRSLEQKEGYPEAAVIYCAVVREAIDARVYYAPASPFRKRPDCVYLVDQESGVFEHTGLTALHATPDSQRRDLGRFPQYRNGRVLLCEPFRYFGAKAVPLPASAPRLLSVVTALGQGHRVFESGHDVAIDAELQRVFRSLLRRPTRFTPREVQADAYERRAYAANIAGGVS